MTLLCFFFPVLNPIYCHCSFIHFHTPPYCFSFYILLIYYRTTNAKLVQKLHSQLTRAHVAHANKHKQTTLLRPVRPVAQNYSEKSSLLQGFVKISSVLVQCQTQRGPRLLPASLWLAISSYYHLSMLRLPAATSEVTPRPDYEAMWQGTSTCSHLPCKSEWAEIAAVFPALIKLQVDTQCEHPSTRLEDQKVDDASAISGINQINSSTLSTVYVP